MVCFKQLCSSSGHSKAKHILKQTAAGDAHLYLVANWSSAAARRRSEAEAGAMQNENMSLTDRPSCKNKQVLDGNVSLPPVKPAVKSAKEAQKRVLGSKIPRAPAHLSEHLCRLHHAVLLAEEVAAVQQRLPLKCSQQRTAHQYKQRLNIKPEPR